MNVTIPRGQRCQAKANSIMPACNEPADYGLVAQPHGGLVMYVCSHCADLLCALAERIDEWRGASVPVTSSERSNDE